MLPANLLLHIIRPAHKLLSSLMGREMGGNQAEVLSLAIALQESRAKHRAQIRGPARSFWQFEKGGGFVGVRGHSETKQAAAALTAELNLPAEADALWTSFPHNDLLAAGFARLLLYSDPQPLPAYGDQGESWSYYIRNWRPGKPHPASWPECYRLAKSAVDAAP